MEFPRRLTVRLCKRPGKLPLLVCTREDGSSTVSEMTVGPEHDLAHYAVETVLGLRRGFYGLVAGGMNIEDFNVPGAAQRLKLPDEAIYTEYIVGLLQVEWRSDAPYSDFNAELRGAVAAGRNPLPPPPQIDEAQLGEIRQRLDELVMQWSLLPADGSIELSFHWGR